ncbi:MAG: 1-acyl-sn-glycerol-3-phosphate acyltransferase [Treponema sp.]|nr:1-acyl-sn-glycerol-3-phosphate acyltransferase [Treponema sp.]
MGIPLVEKYKDYIAQLTSASFAASKIDEINVYQEANPATRKFMDKLLDELLLPGSDLAHKENFKTFYEEVVNNGKRGLILMEHFTNLDLPIICYELERQGEDWAKDLSKRIVAIAGMKLNEENPVVRAFAEGFTRVVIYPSRSLDKLDSSSSEEKAIEFSRARKINMAAMRAMDACKKRGQVILVFPSGTRYRPGKPETKRGLREIDSYLRMFDVMLLVSINGNCLRINPDEPDNMIMDLVEKDKVILSASPVINCKEFRANVLSSLSSDESDPKQKTVDKIMEILESQHNEIEKTRLL